jgi:hypothetical protein
MRCRRWGDRADLPVESLQLYPDHGELQAVLKTAAAAGTTTVSGWASQLVNTSSIFADFVEYLRPRQQRAVRNKWYPYFCRVPFRQYLSANGRNIDHGSVKTTQAGQRLTFASTSLIPYKVAGISVATMELLRTRARRRGNPSDDLARAVAAKIDTDFFRSARA